jgi:hypothetical protein
MFKPSGREALASATRSPVAASGQKFPRSADVRRVVPMMVHRTQFGRYTSNDSAFFLGLPGSQAAGGGQRLEATSELPWPLSSRDNEHQT